MNKVIKISVAAIAALALSTVLVSATVANFSEEKIEVSSKSCPAINCTMAVSEAEGIFALLPSNIKDLCRSEYAVVSKSCKDKGSFTYQGVKVHTSGDGDTVDITFNYGGYTIAVKNTTWDRLDMMFR